MHYIICNKVCSRRLHLNVTCTHSFYVNQYANCIDNSAKRIRRERVRARTRTHAHVLSYKIHRTQQRTVKTTKRKIMIKFVRVWIRIRIDLHISPPNRVHRTHCTRLIRNRCHCYLLYAYISFFSVVCTA